MKLLSEILEKEGADVNYAYTVIPDFGAYFKKVKGIVDYSTTEVKLNINGHSVMVSGEDLTIGKFFEGDLLILGKIKVTNFE
jgi:sporulation protein YqfC